MERVSFFILNYEQSFKMLSDYATSLMETIVRQPQGEGLTVINFIVYEPKRLAFKSFK
jgi:hypothetical protein